MESGWYRLAANVGHALRFAPPLYVRSVVGNPSSWVRRWTPDTEFQLAEPRRLAEGLQAASRIVIPGWPRSERSQTRKDQDSLFYRVSDAVPYPRSSAPTHPYPNESWLLLNGICTDEHVREINAECVYRMFGRPLTLLHNQTHGVALDLVECALGKSQFAATEAVRRLFPALYSELLRPDIDRVVLIAHSQGTILAAVFLAMLRKLLSVPQARGEVPDNAASPEGRRAEALLRVQSTARVQRLFDVGHGQSGARLVPLRADSESETRRREALREQVAAWFEWAPGIELGLPALEEAQLRKLEVYCFATCATDLRPVIDGERPAPHLEHFGNARDLVARLGMLAPERGAARTRISGLKFEREGAWGHLLNAHYLIPLERQWLGRTPAGFVESGGADSRLKAAYLEARSAER